MAPPFRAACLLLPLCLGGCLGWSTSQTITLAANPAPNPDRVSAQPALAITTLGFSSCGRENRPQPIWAAINAQHCDAFVLAGDNIYGDSADPEVLRAKYALFAAQPGFAELRQNTPLFATWDDHDYGINDGGAGWKGAAAAQKEFCDFWDLPANSPRRSSPGVYDCVTLGPVGQRVQLILLDTRSFRSPLKKNALLPKANVPNTDPGVTILGEEQWAWLERRLREPAEVRVVVSSIQLIPEEHIFEKWQNFPAERSRFLQLLQTTRAKGVVIVSGDRHQAEMSRLTAADGAPYPLYEMTTSGLNQAMSQKFEANRHRTHESAYGGSNFGLLHLNWTTPHPSLRFEVCGLDGTPVLTQNIPLAEITKN